MDSFFRKKVEEVFIDNGSDIYEIPVKGLIHINDCLDCIKCEKDIDFEKQTEKQHKRFVKKQPLDIKIDCSIDYINEEINITKGVYKYGALLTLIVENGDLKNETIKIKVYKIDFIDEAITKFNKKYEHYKKQSKNPYRPHYNSNMLEKLFYSIAKKYQFKTETQLLNKVYEVNDKIYKEALEINKLELDVPAGKRAKIDEKYKCSVDIFNHAIEKEKEKLLLFLYNIDVLKSMF
jgi:hypothetical protein